jgi:hypothetical protein
MTVAATASCPACQHHVDFWSINRQGECAELLSYPTDHGSLELVDTKDLLSPALERAYVSTVEAYNARNYVATAVCCRRTLEGVFKTLLSEDKKALPLAKAIESAAADVDFAAPIRALADVVRKGGNLGAHFDGEQEPSQELALAMVRLLESLIEYLFVLPKSIAEAEQELAGGK